MKINSQVVLTLLFSNPQNEPFFLSYEHLYRLLHSVSRVGVRSLVHQLKKQGIILTESVQQRTEVRLSAQGYELAKHHISGLRTMSQAWDGTYSLVLFLTAPGGDAQFRYLRATLLSAGAVGLSRGLYVFVGEVPVQVKYLCQHQYTTAVAIYKVGETIQGDLRDAIIHSLDLTQVVATYSGISSQLAALIAGVGSYYLLNDRQKTLFYSLFHQFCAVFFAEMGLSSCFFTKEVAVAELLKSFQSFVSME